MSCLPMKKVSGTLSMRQCLPSASQLHWVAQYSSEALAMTVHLWSKRFPAHTEETLPMHALARTTVTIPNTNPGNPGYVAGGVQKVQMLSGHQLDGQDNCSSRNTTQLHHSQHHDNKHCSKNSKKAAPQHIDTPRRITSCSNLCNACWSSCDIRASPSSRLSKSYRTTCRKETRSEVASKISIKMHKYVDAHFKNRKLMVSFSDQDCVLWSSQEKMLKKPSDGDPEGKVMPKYSSETSAQPAPFLIQVVLESLELRLESPLHCKACRPGKPKGVSHTNSGHLSPSQALSLTHLFRPSTNISGTLETTMHTRVCNADPLDAQFLLSKIRCHRSDPSSVRVNFSFLDFRCVVPTMRIDSTPGENSGESVRHRSVRSQQQRQ